MTHQEITRNMQAIAEALANRVEIWVQVVEADGTLAERVYQGSFQRSPGTHIGERPDREKRPDSRTIAGAQ